jgi:hypothetical protein
MAQEDNWAWAGGFYEGEGTIGCWNNALRLQVSQQHMEPLLRFQTYLGGIIYSGRQTATQKEFYTLTIYGRRGVVHAIMVMWPWLSERRREQAANAIDRFADVADIREYFCGNKIHVRTVGNTAIRGNGSRRCKDCEKESWKKRTLLNSSR